jgi:hypothetical protein
MKRTADNRHVSVFPLPRGRYGRAFSFACLCWAMQHAGIVSAASDGTAPVSPRQEAPAETRPPLRTRSLPPIERQPLPPPASSAPAATRAAPAAPVIEPVRPSPLTGCDAGGCAGTDGNRYSGGAANTYLDRNGRPCNRSGTWMQCF